MLASRSSVVRDALDIAIKKASETQMLLGRFKTGSDGDPRAEGKYSRLADNFSKVALKIENSMKRYQEQVTSVTPGVGQQMTVMSERSEPFIKTGSYKPPSSYEYISSMEEGTQGQTLQDLQRINRDMNSLQDIYVSLSEAANTHGSLLDSVQTRMGEISNSASSAVQELKRASDRMDYWTRVKLYAVSGVAAVGLFFWIV